MGSDTSLAPACPATNLPSPEFIDPTVACVRTFLGWREALDLAMRIAAIVMRLRIATT
jgi:hypothetical protein